MQSIRVTSKSRQALARVLQNPSPILANSSVLDELATDNAHLYSCTCCRCIPTRRRFHSGVVSSNNEMRMIGDIRLYSTAETAVQNNSEDAGSVKGLYDKMLNSVDKMRVAPPNAWLWSLIAKCSTPEDIQLLFDILQRLRIFRLYKLKIAEDFKRSLSLEVTKACIRAGAIDFGKRSMSKRNLVGLRPDTGSANSLLLHAKQQGDVELMFQILDIMENSDLPMLPGTADIVFSICSSANRLDLAIKYGNRFSMSGVKLRQTSLDIWMESSAKKGDVESLWKAEKLRSETMKKHSLTTGFSCAKGYLLDHKPESAAAVIQELNESLLDEERENIAVELQKLASQWPLELIKHQEDENKQAFAAALQNDISAMINALPSLGVHADVEMIDLSNLASEAEAPETEASKTEVSV